MLLLFTLFLIIFFVSRCMFFFFCARLPFSSGFCISKILVTRLVFLFLFYFLICSKIALVLIVVFFCYWKWWCFCYALFLLVFLLRWHMLTWMTHDGALYSSQGKWPANPSCVHRYYFHAKSNLPACVEIFAGQHVWKLWPWLVSTDGWRVPLNKSGKPP